MSVPPTAVDLAARLLPTHLDTAADEDRLAAAKAVAAPTPAPKDLAQDPRAQEQWAFDLRYVDGFGRLWEGHFVTKILSNRELLQAGALRASFYGHQYTGAFDETTHELSLMLSRLEFCLVEKPAWAGSFLDFNRNDVLEAIYAKVLEHEIFFRTPPSGSGARREQAEAATSTAGVGAKEPPTGR